MSPASSVSPKAYRRRPLPDFKDSAAAAAEWRLCAAAIAGQPAMRTLVRRKGRPMYPASTQRPLSEEPPGTPAAVMLFDSTGRLRCLALDFDAGKADAGQVAADAAEAVQLLTEAGLRPFVDAGPTGGRHLYAALPQPAPAHEAAQVATALTRLLPTLDPSPLLNPVHGCLRPPGAVHKTGGHQRLLTPLPTVHKALTAAPDPQAWQTLRQLLAADRIEVPSATPAIDATAAVGVSKRSLPAGYDELARTGRHPDRSYPSPSEKRMAVIGAAVRAGWDLADLERAITGPWTWLRDQLTGKYGNTWRTRVAAEFTKAKNNRSEHLSRRPVRDSDTSPRTTRGGSPQKEKGRERSEHLVPPAEGRADTSTLNSIPAEGSPTHTPSTTAGTPPTTDPLTAPPHGTPSAGDGRPQPNSSANASCATPPSAALPLTAADLADPYLALRKFYTFAVAYGRRERFSPTLRSVLRAAVWMGQVTGRHTVSSGCRTLAEQAGCHTDTVAASLHELAGHGLVTRLKEGSGPHADLWLLRVRLADQHRPARGSIRGLHHVFRVIGGHDTGEVYDELARAVSPITAKAMASRLGYPTSRIHEQLRLLAGWQLAERSIDGWTVGPADIEALGRQLGGYDAWQAQHDRHVEERRRWHEYLLGRGHLAQLAGQIAWDDEFAAVADDQDAWIQDLASGSPPPTLDDAIRLARHALGGVVIA